MRCLYYTKCDDKTKAKKGDYNTKCYHTEDWMKCIVAKYLEEHTNERD